MDNKLDMQRYKELLATCDAAQKEIEAQFLRKAVGRNETNAYNCDQRVR